MEHIVKGQLSEGQLSEWAGEVHASGAALCGRGGVSCPPGGLHRLCVGRGAAMGRVHRGVDAPEEISWCSALRCTALSAALRPVQAGEGEPGFLARRGAFIDCALAAERQWGGAPRSGCTRANPLVQRSALHRSLGRSAAGAGWEGGADFLARQGGFIDCTLAAERRRGGCTAERMHQGQSSGAALCAAPLSLGRSAAGAGWGRRDGFSCPPGGLHRLCRSRGAAAGRCTRRADAPGERLCVGRRAAAGRVHPRSGCTRKEAGQYFVA
jgi:hypothetical protein